MSENRIQSQAIFEQLSKPLLEPDSMREGQWLYNNRAQFSREVYQAKVDELGVTIAEFEKYFSRALPKRKAE